MAPSSSSTAPTAAPGGSSSVGGAVDPNRKQALLLEARRARVAWVDEVPTSCRRSRAATSPSSLGGVGGAGGGYMKTLKSVKACESMKSAVDVVSFLYGATAVAAADGDCGLSASQAEERVLRQLESQMSTDDIRKAMNDYSATIASPPLATATSNNFEQFETHFQQFLQKLRSPECAELVQGMRHFVHSIEDMATSMKKNSAALASSSSKVNQQKKKAASPAPSRNMSVARDIVADTEKTKGQKTEDKKEEEGEDINSEHDKNLEKISKAIRNYLDNTYESILSHPLWKKQKKKTKEPEQKNNDDNPNRNESVTKEDLEDEDDAKNNNMIKLALETFIFARCYDVIWSFLLSYSNNLEEEQSITSSKMDRLMSERLQSLQFVTPAHLEIQCLTSKKTEEKSEEKDLSDKEEEEKSHKKDTADKDDGITLSEPIQSLLSMDDQYSPGRMLHCILDVYRGVNSALSSALTSKENPPGADDVLPTLILTVLRAQPTRIVSNLRFIELFATPEQLRGEAGYAYTNLYGAVQFIKDLNLDQSSAASGNDDDDGTPANDGISLHISQEEFRAGLKRCRAEATKLRESATTMTAAAAASTSNTEQEKNDVKVQHDTIIPLQEIRKARMRGENIDLDWAHRWQETNNGRTMPTNNGSSHEPILENSAHLPQGFSRSYSFLTTKAEDVRLSDLPQLLSEYRMLVHATESLLAERTARHNAEYKRHVKETRDRLEMDAAEAAAGVSASKKD